MKLSPTAVRWLAVPLGLTAFAGRLALTLWWEPRTYRWSFGPGMAALGAAAAVGIAVVFGLFALLAGGKKPAALAWHGGEACVPPSPYFAGSQAILWMWLAGGMVMTERVPHADAMRIDRDDGAPVMSGIAVSLFFGVAAAILLIHRPRLEFDADGLTIRRLRTVQRLEWDRLAHGGPLPPRKRQRYLRLYLNEPPILGSYPPSVDIRLARLHVDPAFLGETIQRYVEHPEERAALPGGGKPQGAPSI